MAREAGAASARSTNPRPRGARTQVNMSKKTQALPYEKVTDGRTRAEWLEARRQGLGSSEIATVLGHGRRGAFELWAEKTGKVSSPDLREREEVYWADELRPLLARSYATPNYAGRSVVLCRQLLRSLAHPWALTTIHAWAGHADHGRIPLVIKTTASYRSEEWSGGPPERVRLQLQHQMLVTGAAVASVACLIGGQRFVWWDVARDDTVIGRIVDAGASFWRRVLSDEAPPIDGSRSARSTLNRLHGQSDGSRVQLPANCMEWDATLREAKAQRKEAQLRAAEAENRIRLAMGDAQLGVLPDGTTFTLKTQSVRERVLAPTSYRVLRRKPAKGARGD